MTQPKPCPACSHVEHKTIDGALSAGISARSLVRRYAGLSRKAVQKHRDTCLARRAKPGGRVIPIG